MAKLYRLPPLPDEWLIPMLTSYRERCIQGLYDAQDGLNPRVPRATPPSDCADEPGTPGNTRRCLSRSYRKSNWQR